MAVFIDLIVNVAKITAGDKKLKKLLFPNLYVGYGLMEKKIKFKDKNIILSLSCCEA